MGVSAADQYEFFFKCGCLVHDRFDFESTRTLIRGAMSTGSNVEKSPRSIMRRDDSSTTYSCIGLPLDTGNPTTARDAREWNIHGESGLAKDDYDFGQCVLQQAVRRRGSTVPDLDTRLNLTALILAPVAL